MTAANTGYSRIRLIDRMTEIPISYENNGNSKLHIYSVYSVITISSIALAYFAHD